MPDGLTENEMDKVSVEFLRRDLIRDEGYRLVPYFDTEGFVSFGVGRNLVGNALTPEERAMGKKLGFDSTQFVDYLLDRDIDTVLSDLDSFPWVKELPENTQRGLANMRFQLGASAFRDFKLSLSCLERGRLQEAGKHLRQSRWYKQTPGRAERTIRLIEGKHV